MYLNTQERPAAASTQPQQAEFPACLDHQAIASGNSWQIVSRLTVVLASRKLVQIGQRMCGSNYVQFSVMSEDRGRDQKKVLQSLKDRIFTKPLNGKLNWPCEERKWLSENCMKLRQKWRQKIGRREILTLLFMRSIRSSNHQVFQLHRPSRWADQAQ